jgi:hypothetical protein
LTSKNKSFYVEALFVIRQAFKQEMTINKSDLVSMLISSLDEGLLDIDMEAEKEEFESDENSEKGEKSLSSTAHYILRRLAETGWIETEYQINSFEEGITLPDYTVNLLNLLYSFTDQTISEYNSYVYSTYSALRTADSDRDDFMYNALLTAYENTTKLIDELKTLHNNIRRYHQALNDYVSANDVLKGHFDEYKELIMDRIYHPLKTLDSVPRFKAPIIKILSDWLSNYDLKQKIAAQAVQRGKYDTTDEAMDGIIIIMGEISDMYEGMDNMLEEIDRKNSAYTRASIEKMQYLLNIDRSIKGKLVDILSTKTAEEKLWVDTMVEGVNLYKQSYLGEKSLYMRANSSKRKDARPLKLEDMDRDAGENAIKDFVENARKLYSHRKVVLFMENMMAGKQIVNSQDIAINSDEDFVLLILAALKNGEKRLFYQVEFDEGYIYCGRYRIPRMRFVRKGKNSCVG